MPVIGYLYAGESRSNSYLVAAFRKGLSETGFVEGKNVAIEFRWAENQIGRLPTLAAELVDHKVAVIVGPPPSPPPFAGQTPSPTNSIVFFSRPRPSAMRVLAHLPSPLS